MMLHNVIIFLFNVLFVDAEVWWSGFILFFRGRLFI